MPTESSFHPIIGFRNDEYSRTVDLMFANAAATNVSAAVQESSNSSGSNFGKQPTPMKV